MTALLIVASCNERKVESQSWSVPTTAIETDSASFVQSHHYWKGQNFIVLNDTLYLNTGMLSASMTGNNTTNNPKEHLKKRKNELLIVTDIRLVPEATDTIWVQIADLNSNRGWIAEHELLSGVVSDDPIARMIGYIKRLPEYLITICAIFSSIIIGLFFRRYRKQSPSLSHSYSHLLIFISLFWGILISFIILFFPDVWQSYCLQPRLSPFFSDVSPLISIWLLCTWLFPICALAFLFSLRRSKNTSIWLTAHTLITAVSIPALTIIIITSSVNIITLIAIFTIIALLLFLQHSHNTNKTEPAQRLAYSRVHLPDGSILPNHVIEVDANGNIVSYYPLREEKAATKWIGGDYYLNQNN